MKYVVYFSYKDDENKPNDVPLCPFDTDLEARSYRDGYVDAILNHTGNAKRSEVFGMMSIRKVGENLEDNNNKKKKGSRHA